jgi:hypothetical protein
MKLSIVTAKLFKQLLSTLIKQRLKLGYTVNPTFKQDIIFFSYSQALITIKVKYVFNY